MNLTVTKKTNHVKEVKDDDEPLCLEDVKKVIQYKDDVKRMKEELHANNMKLDHMKKQEFVKTGREFDEQVKKASEDLKILEEKIAILDKECESRDNPELNANVLKAAQELKSVKKKVEKWEADAEVLNGKIDKFEKEGICKGFCFLLWEKHFLTYLTNLLVLLFFNTVLSHNCKN